MSTLKRYNGSSWETISGTVTGDTLPIGSEVDYDGASVPAGWEQVSDIIESGSNANGYYVKFNDGTMICWKTTTFDNMVITNQYQGVYYANTGSIAFPEQFIEAPNILATAHTAGGGFSMYGGTTGSEFSGFVWKVQSDTILVPLTWIAIGRWKV